MNTLDIHNVLSSNRYTKKYFKGVFLLDNIPKYVKKRPALLVVNHDKSFLPGSHWVAIFLPKTNRTNAEFFDSYGTKPIHKEFLKFFKQNH